MQHETEQEPRLGTDETEKRLSRANEDDLLDITKVIERFKTETRARLREKSQEHYARTFVRFAEFSGLGAISRRTLGGAQGRTLILRFMETIPRLSWRYAIAELKAVWTYGMGLPWPIDARRDFGKMPNPRRRETPPDDTVRMWADAMTREKDLRLRLEWLLISQLGLRPSHVYKLKWRNIRTDASGNAFAIVADGAQEGFKTDSPVAAWLPPNVVQTVEEWRKLHPAPHSENPILPWRDASRVDPSREQDPRALRDRFVRLSKKWGLPVIRPVDLRHWVASACRRSGLSKVASAHMMGHDPSQNGSMRDWYDRPQLDDIFQEQAEKLPNGPLGLLRSPELELVDGLPQEAVRLLAEYLDGTIGTLDLASRAERLRASMIREPEQTQLRV